MLFVVIKNSRRSIFISVNCTPSLNYPFLVKFKLAYIDAVTDLYLKFVEGHCYQTASCSYNAVMESIIFNWDNVYWYNMLLFCHIHLLLVTRNKKHFLCEITVIGMLFSSDVTEIFRKSRRTVVNSFEMYFWCYVKKAKNSTGLASTIIYREQGNSSQADER